MQMLIFQKYNNFTNKIYEGHLKVVYDDTGSIFKELLQLNNI